MKTTQATSAPTSEDTRRPGEGTAGILLTESEGLVARQVSLIDRLSPEDRERVRGHGRPRQLLRGETLFSQGDPHEGIFTIESGLLRTFYSAPSGREITLAYWSAGNFVGGPEIFGGGTHMWTSVAAHQSVVTVLPGQGLRELAREVPDLALGIIDALVFKAKCYSSLAQILGTRSLTQRLGQLLLHLVHTYGIEDKEGVLIAATFTHAEIANLIGGTRQWVTISLNRLMDAGVLTHRHGSMVVRRIDALVADHSDP